MMWQWTPSDSDTARSIKHLYAAFFATWIIHIGYIVFLIRKGKKLRDEADELKRGR